MMVDRPGMMAAGLAAVLGVAATAVAEETPKQGGMLTYMIPADAPPSLDGHRETTYATISMTITGPPPPVHHHHHAHKAAAGFLGGLTAGWRALRVVVAGLLTVAGAVLPFAIPLGLAALAAVAGRRWLGRRRAAGARPAG